jgi:hypothetical protein
MKPKPGTGQRAEKDRGGCCAAAPEPLPSLRALYRRKNSGKHMAGAAGYKKLEQDQQRVTA